MCIRDHAVGPPQQMTSHLFAAEHVKKNSGECPIREMKGAIR